MADTFLNPRAEPIESASGPGRGSHAQNEPNGRHASTARAANGTLEPERRERGPRITIGWPNLIHHRIDLLPHPKRYDGAEMFYRGRKIGLSRNGAIYEAARWLLKEGLAAAQDWVGTYRGEAPCMAGQAGELAQWVAKESSKVELHFERYRPMSDEQKAMLRATGNGEAPPTAPGLGEISGPESALPEGAIPHSRRSPEISSAIAHRRAINPGGQH